MDAASAASDGALPAPSLLSACEESKLDDTRDTATPYVIGTTVAGCVGSDDVDVFVVTTPKEDLAGGYYQLEVIDPENAVSVSLNVDNDKSNFFGMHTGQANVPALLFWAGAPGETYSIWIGRFFGGNFKYKLRVTYTKLNDPYEPNDTKATALPIALGTPIKPYLFAGVEGGISRFELAADWFAFDAAVGPTTFLIDDVPADAAMTITLHGPAGGEVASFESHVKGQRLTGSFNVKEPGRYYVGVNDFYGPSTPANLYDTRKLLPETYLKPYTLTVSQP